MMNNKILIAIQQFYQIKGSQNLHYVNQHKKHYKK